MKNYLMNILAVGALAAGTIVAQTHAHTAPDATTMVAHQVDRLTSLLTLTAAQQTQATTLFTNAAAANAALRTNMQTARTSLKTAVQANDTASIDNLTAQIGSISGQELNISSKADAGFYALLTADQKTKYAALRGPGGPGGPGPMGRGPQGAHFGGARQ